MPPVHTPAPVAASPAAGAAAAAIDPRAARAMQDMARAAAQIANGQASKIWVLPAELSRSIGALGEAFAGQMNPWTAPAPPAEAPSPEPQQSAEGQPTGA